ncbi:Hsp20 family protein [Candidatus Pantoea edessiphila]|uniref:Hsp20 family protein n=1 Tax=Candidatus Pantoea edessiphila TaxID=2044610 RepID=UPI0030D108CA
MDTPSYNLLQRDKESYELTVSVPGYCQSELDVTMLNNQLTISGKPNLGKDGSNEEKNENVRWLHQGIKKSEFSLSFSLEHRINISHSSLCNGLLVLRFSYDIPEREKPQKISIGVQNETGRVIEHHGS